MSESAVTQVILALIAAGVSLGLKWLDSKSKDSEPNLQPEPDDESLGSESNAQTDTLQAESALEQTDEEYDYEDK